MYCGRECQLVHRRFHRRECDEARAERCAREYGRAVVTSPASPALFLKVLARVAENGYSAELADCVALCCDTRDNLELRWLVYNRLRVPSAAAQQVAQAQREGRPAVARSTWWHSQSWCDDPARDADSRTLLMLLAQAGDLRRVREAVRRGARVHAANGAGRTALHYASEGGHTDVVAFLLECGADVGARDLGDGTPLAYARQGGFDDVVSLLAAYGADEGVRLSSRRRGAPTAYGVVTLDRVRRRHDEWSDIWYSRRPSSWDLEYLSRHPRDYFWPVGLRDLLREAATAAAHAQPVQHRTPQAPPLPPDPRHARIQPRIRWR